jgi:16S rRNA (guanine527-N7)-methyltransferase
MVELITKYFPDLTAEQLRQFEALGALYADWNAKINVVSRKDFDQLYLRHILHSLAIAKVCQFEPGARVLDVGCGGGFPSIPLAIMFPEVQFTAVDSIAKDYRRARCCRGCRYQKYRGSEYARRAT